MNQSSPISDEELEAACGYAEIAGESAAARVVELSLLIAQVKSSLAELPAQLSSDFNAKLQSQLLIEKKSGKHHPWWRRLTFSLPVAVAAALALVLFWSAQFPPARHAAGETAVVWADVVQAVRTVGQCHVIAYIQNPTAADPAERFRRIDWFYKSPGHWRAQIDGEIEFGSAGNDRIWNIKSRAWDSDSDNKRRLLPAKMTAGIEAGDMLTPLLAMVFDNEVPRGEPVKSDEPATAHGIDVFDFSHRPNEQWARIWVLHDSRLPLRMHVFQPGVDGFQSVEFDYSDPQPDSFFDADHFAARAATMPADDRGLYNVGSAPVSGTLPRGADQIYTVNGGYHAPKIVRIRSDADGDILIVNTPVNNQSPQGYSMIARYRDITDNWGNRFIEITGASHEIRYEQTHWYYMPLQPFKTGVAPRQITFSCVVQNTQSDPPIFLQTQTMDVPDASVPGTGKDWDWKNLDKSKQETYAEYVRESGTLAQQLNLINATLAADPDDFAASLWKFNLLMQFNRAPAAWALFENDLRDRVFSSVESLERNSGPASEYLLYLLAQNRDSDHEALTRKITDLINIAAASKDPQQRDYAKDLNHPNIRWLRAAMQAGQWRDTFKDDPKVVRTVAGRDGRILVELAIPTPPKDWDLGWNQQPPADWFWQPMCDEAWQGAARLVQIQQGRLILVFQGHATQVTLRGQASLAEDRGISLRARNSIAALQYSRTIAVPPPTVDSIAELLVPGSSDRPVEWINGFGPNSSPAQPTSRPVYLAMQWRDQADALREAGKFQAALDLYAKALAAPNDQWPADFSMTNNPQLPRIIGQMQVSESACLAAIGKFDEARAIAGKIRSALPTPPNWSDLAQISTAGEALDADLNIARALFKTGNINAAATELNRIEKYRPDLSTLPSWYVRDAASNGFNPHGQVQAQWSRFDELWWDVQDRMASKP